MTNAVIVIPAHNEAKAIAPLVKALRALNYPCVVVDDGSADDTAGQARGAGAVVVPTGKKSGKGRALRKGFEYALAQGHTVVIAMDGDGQHLPEDVKAFVDCYESTQADIVTGNRMKNPQGMPWLRLATNRFMSWLISVVCRQRIPDTQCGFRLMTARALQSLTLTCDDFEIETEVLVKAAKQGFTITSVPIQTIYRNEVSKINPLKDTFRFISYIAREICKG